MQKQLGNVIFLKNEAGTAGQENDKSYGLWETLKIIGKSMASSLQSWQRWQPKKVPSARQGTTLGSHRKSWDSLCFPMATSAEIV